MMICPLDIWASLVLCINDDYIEIEIIITSNMRSCN